MNLEHRNRDKNAGEGGAEDMEKMMMGQEAGEGEVAGMCPNLCYGLVILLSTLM